MHRTAFLLMALFTGCGDAKDLGGRTAVDALGSSGKRSPVLGDLVITELMINPQAVGDTEGEWFAFRNVSGTDIDLLGLYVHDPRDAWVDMAIKTSLVLADGEEFIVCRNGDSKVNGGINCDASGGILLRNDGDQVAISIGKTVLDAVLWDGADVFSGSSSNLHVDFYNAVDNDDLNHWCEATSEMANGDYGTPGADNDLCEVWLDQDKDGHKPIEGDCDDFDGDTYPGAPDTPGDNIDHDCSALMVDDLLPGDVLITEFMANPRLVGDSVGEWIEITNMTGTEVDLRDVSIGNPTVSYTDFEFPDRLIMEADDVFVLTRSDQKSNGGIVPDFVSSDIQLINSGDALGVIANGFVIDGVSYTSADISNGASLELRGDRRDEALNDNLNNWCTARSVFGIGDLGTPGEVNDACLPAIDLTDQGLVISAGADPFANGMNAPTVELDPVGGQLRMFFEYEPSDVTPPGDCIDVQYIGTATSSDGLTWTTSINPVIVPPVSAGVPDATAGCGAAQPAAVHDGTVWHLFYRTSGPGTSGTANANTGIGYATSVDGSTFTVVAEPLWTTTGGGQPSAMVVGSELQVYWVSPPNIVLATSSDGGSSWSVGTATELGPNASLSWMDDRVFSPATVCEDRFPDDWLFGGMLFGGKDAVGNRTTGMSWNLDVTTAWIVENELDGTSVDPTTWYHHDLVRMEDSFNPDVDYLVYYSVDSGASKAIGVGSTRGTWDTFFGRRCP